MATKESVLSPIPLKSFVPRSRCRKESIWKDLVEKVIKLKAGEGLPYNIEKGEDVTRLRAKVHAALRYQLQRVLGDKAPGIQILEAQDGKQLLICKRKAGE